MFLFFLCTQPSQILEWFFSAFISLVTIKELLCYGLHTFMHIMYISNVSARNKKVFKEKRMD